MIATILDAARINPEYTRVVMEAVDNLCERARAGDLLCQSVSEAAMEMKLHATPNTSEYALAKRVLDAAKAYRSSSGGISEEGAAEHER